MVQLFGGVYHLNMKKMIVMSISSPVEVGEGYMVCVGSKKVYCLTDP